MKTINEGIQGFILNGFKPRECFAVTKIVNEPERKKFWLEKNNLL